MAHATSLRVSGRNKEFFRVIALLGLMCWSGVSWGQLFWNTNGTGASVTSPNWSTNGSAPFTSAWVSASNINFTSNSAITFVTNTIVGNLTITNGSTVTWTAAGTYSTGGAVKTFDIGSGSTLIWNGQTISTVNGTGFVKNGLGTWNIGAQSGGYPGGFTLNAGTIIVGGTNALGSGALTINGGILAPNTSSARDFSSKFSGGIIIGGDFQFGDAINITGGTGNLTFSNITSLGGITRTITIGGIATYTLGGVISGTNSAGLTVNSTSTGVLSLTGANTYTGSTTINSGTLALSGTGSISSSPNIIISSGGKFDVSGLTTALTLGSGQTLKASATGSNTTGTVAVVSSKGLTLSSGGLVFTGYGGGSIAPLTVSGPSAGALALNSAPITVTTTSALAVGTYTLIEKGGSATGVSGTPGTLIVNGEGLAAQTMGTLSVSSGQLILTVTSVSTPLFSISGTTNHGSSCLNTSATNQTYTITNTGTDATNVAVSSSDPQFVVSNLSSTDIARSGGTATYDVTFTPASTGVKSATITVYYDTNTSAKTSSLSGTGVNTIPTVTTNAATGIGFYTATLPGTINFTGCTAISAYGIEYSTTNGFTNGAGTQVVASNLLGSNYSVALSGLSLGTTYYYKSYATNDGGTAYSAQGSFTTLTPAITVGTVTAFGNQTVNTTSSEKSYSVSATDLISDVTITPPSGFEISLTSGSGFVANPSTIVLSPNNGSLAQTTIYVRFKPTAVSSYTGSITHTASSATQKDVAVGGMGVAVANPASFTATASSTSQINLSATANANLNNIVVVHSSSSSFSDPTNGVAPGNVGETFAGGTILYKGSAALLPNHTELSPTQTVYYKAFSYDASNFYSSGSTASATSKSPTITVGTITAFSNVIVNTISEEKSYTISATDMISSITLTPPAGFEISLTSGAGFVANPSTITLTPTNGTLASTTIFVRFKPTAIISYSGNITHTATSASTKNVAVSGTGIAPTDPTSVSATAASYNQINLTFTPNGSNNVIVAFNTSTTFGTPSGNYSVNDAISGGGTVIYKGTGSLFNHTSLTENTTYYYKVWTVDPLNFYSAGVTATAKTNNLNAPIATAATSTSSTGFTANWNAVNGASVYKMDVSKYELFGFQSAALLNEGFNNGTTEPLNWTFTNIGGTYTTSTNFGISSPSLSFDATNDRVLTLQLSGNAKQLSFWIKGQGTNATSAFLVEGYNGSSWVTIQNITNSIPTTGTTYTYNSGTNPVLPSGIIQFRFTYTKSTGNLAFDDVSITYNVLNPDLVSGYNSLTVSGTSQEVEGLSPNTTYYYRVRATSTNSTSANSNTISVTTDKGASSISATGTTTYVYNGNPQGPSTATVSGSTGTVTYSYSGTGATAYETSSTKPTNAGTYNVVATVAASNDYYGATSSPLEFTITKATPTLLVTGSSIYDYTGSTQGPVAISYNGDGTTSLLYTSTDGGGYSSATAPVNIGAYQVVASAAASNNYNAVTSTPVTFTIVLPAPVATVATHPIVTGFTANWSASAGATNYLLDVATDIGFTNIVSGYNNLSVSGTSTTFSVFFPTAFYYYRVRAVDVQNNISEYSNIITAITAVRSSLDASSLVECPDCDLTIVSGGALNINVNKTFKSITVSPGGKLTLADTKTLTSSVSLQSDATGTATFVDQNTSASNPAINATVQQYLGTARNWYVSSPVSGAVAPGGYTYYQRDEAEASWTSQPFVAGNTFVPGKGYIALPGAAGTTLTFSGSLNTGNVSVPLTQSGASSKGFNLIGNPYPSHLSWTKAFADDATNAALIEPTIWIRTNAGAANNSGQWSFLTYNGHTGLAVPGTSALSGGIIPPMQAFWVKALKAGNLILDSKLTRSHQASNPLKVRASGNTGGQIVRLQLDNGTTTDEVLLYFDAEASNGYDRFDSPKFEEANTVSQIYTSAGAEKLVINGMNNMPLDTPIGLGFIAGNATSFSIKANEINNLPADVKVFLKDIQNPNPFELTDGTAYTFTSDGTGGSDRFSIIFRTAGITTGMNDNDSQPIMVRVNEHNRIVISGNGRVRVFNAIGQQVDARQLTGQTTTIDKPLLPGVYLVMVSGNGQDITRKVIIR